MSNSIVSILDFEPMLLKERERKKKKKKYVWWTLLGYAYYVVVSANKLVRCDVKRGKQEGKMR